MTQEEIAYYRSDPKTKRSITRAALKHWRESHSNLLPVRSLHHGWYGWVLESVSGDRRIVANVMTDCIIPYLKGVSL